LTTGVGGSGGRVGAGVAVGGGSGVSVGVDSAGVAKLRGTGGFNCEAQAVINNVMAAIKIKCVLGICNPAKRGL
jgi:hypothetical protein